MEITPQHILVFRALSHPVRMEILEILVHGPVCVCNLGELIHKRQPCISQHLAVLRQAGLVNTSRRGWNIFYTLNKSTLLELEVVISELLQQIQTD